MVVWVFKSDVTNCPFLCRPIWGEAITSTGLPNGAKMFTTPAPSSGPVLAFILNIMSGYNPTTYSVETMHRLIESLVADS